MAVPLSSPPSLETTCAACSFFRWREALSLVLPQVIVFAPLFALYRERRTTVRVNFKFLHITPSDPHKTSNNGFRITLCPPLQNLLRIKILIQNLCLSPYLLYGCETYFSELAKKAVYSSIFKDKTSDVFTSKLLLCPCGAISALATRSSLKIGKYRFYRTRNQRVKYQLMKVRRRVLRQM